MAEQFWLDRITKAKAQVVLLEDAIDFLYANPHKSYSLDSGQGTQQVSRPDLQSLQDQSDGLLNKIATLEARCNGASQQIIPRF